MGSSPFGDRIGTSVSGVSVGLLALTVAHVAAVPSAFGLALLVTVAVVTGYGARFFGRLDAGDSGTGTVLVILYAAISGLVLTLLTLDGISCSGLLTVPGFTGCAAPVLVFSALGAGFGGLGYLSHVAREYRSTANG